MAVAFQDPTACLIPIQQRWDTISGGLIGPVFIIRKRFRGGPITVCPQAIFPTLEVICMTAGTINYILVELTVYLILSRQFPSTWNLSSSKLQSLGILFMIH